MVWFKLRGGLVSRPGCLVLSKGGFLVAKAIYSKVLACFELGVLFNPKLACLMASVACYSLGCYKPTVVCIRPRWLVGAQDGLSAKVVVF